MKRKLDVKDIKPTGEEMFDPESLLYERKVVKTGSLEPMIRKDALQLVVNIGGRPKDDVPSSTNYLVFGNDDYCKSINDGRSSKQKIDEKLQLAGKDIEIISESVFYEMFGV